MFDEFKLHYPGNAKSEMTLSKWGIPHSRL